MYDENKRLCDVKPFGATIKIVEKQNDKAENVFNVQIGRLIGKSNEKFLVRSFMFSRITIDQRLLIFRTSRI